jgi:hypothetical protein
MICGDTNILKDESRQVEQDIIGIPVAQGTPEQCQNLA